MKLSAMPYAYQTLLRFTSVFTLFFVLTAQALQAQSATKFPEDPNDFVNKLGEFMTFSKRPDMEESFTVFKKMYRAGVLKTDDMKQIVAVSNRLADQNITAFPNFKYYVDAIVAAKTDPDSTIFKRWHSVLERTAANSERGRNKPLTNFLSFSTDFLQKRALKQGEGGSVTWKIRGGKFQFDYQNNQPVLVCDKIDLIGVRKQDSVQVFATSGKYLPVDNIWEGLGGQVNWKNAGLDSTVYAVMTDYKIETIKPLFACDTVHLHYPLYFPEGTIDGKFENNVEVQAKGSATQFPRFESFEKNLKINKIGEGVEYVGGFKLMGSSLHGFGNRSELAQLTVYNNKRQKVFYGTSELFIIKREERIVSEGVDAKLFMENDSLFHPSVNFRLDIPKSIIELNRGQKGSDRNPFFSSFYNMNLEVEGIAWHFAKDSLEIGSRVGVAKGITQRVSFESSNRFDPNEYTRMQSIANKNPISTLYVLSLEQGSNIVSDDAFAQRMDPKFDFSSIQTLLADMVAKGFINYYFDRHEIELRDKLIHYALASQGKKDFDAIKIDSESTGSNAKLDLKTKETTIFEVNRLELSNRQKVAVVPDGRQITLLKNRDMRFKGRLFAGFALFEGKNMHFTYDKFQVEFDSVRNLDFYLPNGAVDPVTKFPKADAMNSTIEKVTGVLLVDAPNNKSGKENLAIFPSLQTKKPSFVFYDRKETQGGAYKRDSFYFQLDPFSFNGLDSYTPDDLKFKGDMVSSNIFPNFKETIVVRKEDKSFGFVHTSPPTGYPTYTKKGKYTGNIDLSNKGFLGKGKVEYLTADVESEDIVFKPKQMTCTAKNFFMEEDRANAVKVPQAKGQDVKVNWLPYRDSMYVESKAKAFDVYKQPGYTHKGVFILTPSGLKGRGEFEWAGGKLTSKLISYGPFQASADTADLQIKALNGKDIAFDSRNFHGQLDFDAQLGQFKANNESATTTLPFDQYRTSMNEFTWNMKAQTVIFKSDPSKPGKFVSIDENQDSLNFLGKTALYDLRTNLLQIGGVEVIKSADAFIYPDSSATIEILSGGKMKELNNARILADTVSKYHVINRATVNIQGKKLYKAKGYYEYNIPGFNQEIFFNDIIGERVGPGTPSTKNVLTTASGDVAEKDTFRMDVRTQFQGKINLIANKQNMRFDGYAKLLGDRIPDPQWFSVHSEVDRNDPLIRIKNSKTKGAEPEPLITGFYISVDSAEAYPRILTVPRSRTDRMLIDCQSFFKYDSKTDKYTFGDSTKVLGTSQKGSKMVFDNRVATVQAEGPINIGEGLQYMKVKAAGKLRSEFNPIDSSGFLVTGEMMSGMEMTIPKQLLDILLDDIKANGFDATVPTYNTQQAFYQPALAEFVSDEKDMEETMTNLKNNVVVLPKKDNKYAFLLGRHNVFWNEDYSSFVSVDDKIAIISVNGEPVNKVFTVMAEYKMPTNGDDRFYMYIKLSSDLWYYFNYQAGALGLVSSSVRFNDAVAGLKAKEKQYKMPDGEIYEIFPIEASKANVFVDRVRSGRKK